VRELVRESFGAVTPSRGAEVASEGRTQIAHREPHIDVPLAARDEDDARRCALPPLDAAVREALDAYVTERRAQIGSNEP
jgi:hypothetical protein